MKIAALILAVLALAACRDDMPDHRVLFDREGCAYYAKPGVGDTTFLYRLPDADEPRCTRRGKAV